MKRENKHYWSCRNREFKHSCFMGSNDYVFVIQKEAMPECYMIGVYKDKAIAKSITRHLNKLNTSKYSRYFVTNWVLE